MIFPKFLLLVVFGFTLQNGIHGKVIAKRSTNSTSGTDGLVVGYTHVLENPDVGSYTAALAGQNFESDTHKTYQHILYANVKATPTAQGGVEFGAGLYRTSGRVKNIFQGGSQRDATYDVEALSARAEFGLGVMGRAKLTDATINTGHVGFNAGVTVDTGAIVKNDALEVKVLGIGGSVGAHGIQACFVFCFGINW